MQTHVTEENIMLEGVPTDKNCNRVTEYILTLKHNVRLSIESSNIDLTYCPKEITFVVLMSLFSNFFIFQDSVWSLCSILKNHTYM